MKYKKELFYSILMFFIWNSVFLIKFLNSYLWSLIFNYIVFILALLLAWLLKKNYFIKESILIPSEQVLVRIKSRLLSIMIYPLIIFILVLWIASKLYTPYIWGIILLVSTFTVFFNFIALHNIKRNAFVVTDELRLSLEISSIYIFVLSTLISMNIFFNNKLSFLIMVAFIGLSLLILEVSHFSNYNLSVNHILLFLSFVAVVVVTTLFSELWGLHLVIFISLIFLSFFMILHLRLKGIKEWKEYLFPLIIFLILFIAFL